MPHILLIGLFIGCFLYIQLLLVIFDLLYGPSKNEKDPIVKLEMLSALSYTAWIRVKLFKSGPLQDLLNEYQKQESTKNLTLNEVLQMAKYKCSKTLQMDKYRARLYLASNKHDDISDEDVKTLNQMIINALIQSSWSVKMLIVLSKITDKMRFFNARLRVLLAIVVRATKSYSSASKKEVADIQVKLAKAKLKFFIARGHTNDISGCKDILSNLLCDTWLNKTGSAFNYAELELVKIELDIAKQQSLIDLSVLLKICDVAPEKTVSSDKVDIEAAAVATRILLSRWPVWAFRSTSKQKLIAKYAENNIPSKAFSAAVIKQLAEVEYRAATEKRFSLAEKKVAEWLGDCIVKAELSRRHDPKVLFVYLGETSEDVKAREQQITNNKEDDRPLLEKELKEEMEAASAKAKADILVAARVPAAGPGAKSILDSARAKYIADNKGYLLNCADKAYMKELQQTRRLLAKMIVAVAKDKAISEYRKVIDNKDLSWYSKLSSRLKELYARATKPSVKDADLLARLKHLELATSSQGAVGASKLQSDLDAVKRRISARKSNKFYVCSGPLSKEYLTDLQAFITHKEVLSSDAVKSLGLSAADITCCGEVVAESVAEYAKAAGTTPSANLGAPQSAVAGPQHPVYAASSDGASTFPQPD